MVFDGRYKLIRGYHPEKGQAAMNANGSGVLRSPNPSQVLLFDLENDPNENSNLASKASPDVRRLSGMIETEQHEGARK
jgi:hypothetical protein